MSTIVSVWGSSKALRGLDGAMDEAVDGIHAERDFIFKCFAYGLLGNLSTVCLKFTLNMYLNFAC